jgi:hypothetical protein
MWNSALARASAFQSQGVTPTFPARSRSGVRDVDGVVVFAIAAALVRQEHWGFSCLLWAPAPSAAATALDQASHAETLDHCRLATRHGTAEGFLVYDAEPAPHGVDVVALRVVKAGKEYWGKWGFAPRAELPRRCAAGSVRP